MAEADDPNDKKPGHTLSDHLLGQDFVHAHDGDADHDHDHFDFDDDEKLEENPIWIQDHVTLVTRRHRHRLGRHAGDLLAHQPAPLRRGPHQPLLRGLARNAVPVAGGAHALCQRRAHRRRRARAIIDEAYDGGRRQARRHRHRRGDPHRRGAAPRERRGDRRLLAEQRGDFVTATAGHHMESMLAAYGSGASKVSLRRGQAHPQHRHRRRHHQARHRREGQRDRDRGAAYRRPAAGGRRDRPHRAARSRRASYHARAGRLLLEPRRRALAAAARRASRRAWRTCWWRR